MKTDKIVKHNGNIKTRPFMSTMANANLQSTVVNNIKNRLFFILEIFALSVIIILININKNAKYSYP